MLWYVSIKAFLTMLLLHHENQQQCFRTKCDSAFLKGGNIHCVTRKKAQTFNLFKNLIENMRKIYIQVLNLVDHFLFLIWDMRKFLLFYFQFKGFSIVTLEQVISSTCSTYAVLNLQNFTLNLRLTFCLSMQQQKRGYKKGWK